MTKHRLTLIEALPEAVLQDCQWLHDTIIAERMSQVDMLEAFNQRMLAAGQPLASLSGFNRYVFKVRNGDVRRPKAILDRDTVDHAVFSVEFRTKLVEKQGAQSVMMLELALMALA